MSLHMKTRFLFLPHEVISKNGKIDVKQINDFNLESILEMLSFIARGRCLRCM